MRLFWPCLIWQISLSIFRYCPSTLTQVITYNTWVHCLRLRATLPLLWAICPHWPLSSSQILILLIFSSQALVKDLQLQMQPCCPLIWYNNTIYARQPKITSKTHWTIWLPWELKLGFSPSHNKTRNSRTCTTRLKKSNARKKFEKRLSSTNEYFISVCFRFIEELQSVVRWAINVKYRCQRLRRALWISHTAQPSWRVIGTPSLMQHITNYYRINLCKYILTLKFFSICCIFGIFFPTVFLTIFQRYVFLVNLKLILVCVPRLLTILIYNY